MMYAIEMYFDKVTEEKIMRLAQKIADAGLSTKYLEWKTRPHVTLAVYNDIDVDRCAQLLEKFANDHKTFPALFDAVGMFNYTKTIFLSPIMTRSIYELHSELYVLMQEFEASAWAWYKQPDCWVPHCTVALTSEDEDTEKRHSTTRIGFFISSGTPKMSYTPIIILRKWWNTLTDITPLRSSKAI